MKRLLYSIVFFAAVCTVSCSIKEDIPNGNEPQVSDPETELITITGNLAEDPLSKTSYDFSSGTEGLFSWIDGDEVALIVKYRKTSDPLVYDINHLDRYRLATHTAQITNGGRTATFTGILSHDTNGDEWLSTGFAIYPWNLSQQPSNSGYNIAYVKVPSTSTGQASSIYLVGTPNSDVSPDNFNFKTAMGVLQVTLNQIPATATKLRLATFDKKKYPLDGNFSLINNDGVVTIAKENYLSDDGNGYIDIDVTSKQSSTNETFYFNVPVGDYPANMLTLSIYDDSSNLLMQKGINQNLTFVRGEVIVTPKITVSAPTWKKLGWGKYIDNFLYGKLITEADPSVYVTNHNTGLSREVPHEVSVLIEQNIATPTQYRIKDPYGVAAEAFGYSLSSHDPYLTFTLSGSSVSTFDTHVTGFIVDSGKKNIQLVYPGILSKSTAYNIVVAGTDTEPEIVQLAPVYTEKDNTGYAYNKFDINNMIRITFPGVSGYDCSYTSSGSSRMESLSYVKGAKVTACRLVLSEYNDVEICSNVFPSTSGSDSKKSTDYHSQAYGSNNKYPGVSGYYSSSGSNDWSSQSFTSGELYLSWFAFNGSGVVGQGSTKVYALNSTDAAKLVGTFAFNPLYTLVHYDRGEYTDIHSQADNVFVLAACSDATRGNIQINKLFGFGSNGNYSSFVVTGPIRSGGKSSNLTGSFGAGASVIGLFSGSTLLFKDADQTPFMTYSGETNMSTDDEWNIYIRNANASATSFQFTLTSDGSTATLTASGDYNKAGLVLHFDGTENRNADKSIMWLIGDNTGGNTALVATRSLD